jgi:hypothetical protein
MRLTPDRPNLYLAIQRKVVVALPRTFLSIYRKLASRDRYGGSHFCFFCIHKTYLTSYDHDY